MTTSSAAYGRRTAELTDHILSDRLDGLTPALTSALTPASPSTLAAISMLAPAPLSMNTGASVADMPTDPRAAVTALNTSVATGYGASLQPLLGTALLPGASTIGPIANPGGGFAGYDVSTGKTVKTAFETYELKGIEDPTAAKQWHLTRLGDLNTVWKDYTGKDVHVGVYDSGVQYAHWDLDDNYDFSREVVIDGKTYDGDYSPWSGPHGTSVAGLIAAERNGQGGVGVSYDAKITSVNIFNPYSEDESKPGIYVNGSDSAKFLEAIRQSDKFDVTNHSWGGRSAYATKSSRAVDGTFAHEMVEALSNGTDNGRGGLGTVHVAAAGNDLYDGQSDAWKTDRHVVAVGAYRESDGNSSYYTSSGAHLLVSAPSNDYAVLGGTGQVTTDLLGYDGYNTLARPKGKSDYTDQFGGTSGATPVVSGVVSLMLDANENLGWRDVRDILAYSAKMPVAFDTGQTAVDYQGQQIYLNNSKFMMAGQDANWNGGAAHYSRDYGYGAVDAYNAVRMAEVWSLFGAAKTSANEMMVSTGQIDVGMVLESQGANNNATFLNDFTGGQKAFTFNVTEGLDIEHLDLTLKFSFDHMSLSGIIQLAMFGTKIKLTAPDGTSGFVDTYLHLNEFFSGLASSGPGEQQFTFGLSGFRGVDMVGTWTLEVEQVMDGLGAIGGVMNINSMKLDAYGSALNTNDVFTYTNEFATMAAIAGESGRKVLSDIDGGTDWINAAAVSKDVVLSLVDGTTATFGGVKAFSIAKGSVIENVVTGDGNDTLYGNTLANEMHGMRGNDALYAAAGNDRLYGGAGDDTLNGGTGADLMDGGIGNDSYTVDDAGDTVVEAANAGTDTVYAGINYTLTAQVENLYLIGNARTGTGNALDNGLFGTGGNDTFYGLDGNDVLKGWAGNDTLYGGAGIDKLYGAEGNDVLDGGKGADLMDGGIGNDTYYVDDIADQVIEYAGNGVDLVYASVNWTLGGNVENLFLTGSADLNATGNALANTIRGNSGANVINGGAGNDVLIGLGGNDTLFGGAGNDTFVFGPGSGKDFVRDFGAGDVIDLSGYAFDAAPTLIDAGANTLIDLGGGNTILVYNIDPDQLTFTGNAFGFAG